MQRHVLNLRTVFRQQHARAGLVTKVPWTLRLQSVVEPLRLGSPAVIHVYVSYNLPRYLRANISHLRFELRFHRRRITKDSTSNKESCILQIKREQSRKFHLHGLTQYLILTILVKEENRSTKNAP